MGYRTLSFILVLRALFLDAEAYDRLRDDDNPFVEGLFLVVAIGALTALLALVGQVIAWATVPSLDEVERIALDAFRRTSWWVQVSSPSESLRLFEYWWAWGWRIFPGLFGAPDPALAALNVLAWPVVNVIGWLIYGALAHFFARRLGGTGTLGQTLGATSLAAVPLLLRGLGVIPFVSVGFVALAAWQVVCRYLAVRSVHYLAWPKAFWATVLPLLFQWLLWALLAVVLMLAMTAMAGR
jgi:hypothetical protein